MKNLIESRVAIIIVSWNVKEYLGKCLSSVFQQTYSHFSVTFVDNGSTDGSIELVQMAFPAVKIISLVNNNGFAKANNIGIRLALEKKALYIVLLNVDTIIHKDFLRELVIAAESDETIGSCQPKMLSMDNPKIIDAIGITIRKNGKPMPSAHGKQDNDMYNQSKEIFGATAGAVLYKSEMLEQIGLFEEECFAYCEDVDLALRARLAGWKCIYVPQAIAYHKHWVTFGKHSLSKKYFSIRNRYYYVIKNLPLCMVLEFLIRKSINIWGLILRLPIQLVSLNMEGFHADTTILKAHYHGIKNIPKMFRKRNEIRSRRVISDQELVQWFVE